MISNDVTYKGIHVNNWNKRIDITIYDRGSNQLVDQLFAMLLDEFLRKNGSIFNTDIFCSISRKERVLYIM